MHIIPLGSSSGKPTFLRGASGYLLAFDDRPDWILVDCGPGVVQKIIQWNAQPAGQRSFPLSDLSTLCITHVHGDHCLDVFNLLTLMNASDRRQPLTIIASMDIKNMVEMVLSIIQNPLEFPVQWIHPEPFQTVSFGEHRTCRFIPLEHRVPSFGFEWTETLQKNNAHVESFIEAGFSKDDYITLSKAIQQAKKGEWSCMPDQTYRNLTSFIQCEELVQSAFIAGDNQNPMLLVEANVNAQCWVHETTYLHADWLAKDSGQRWGHSSAYLLGIAASKAQTPPQHLVLTHFSSRYFTHDPHNTAFIEEIQSVYSGDVSMAHDLQPLYFPPIQRSVSPPSPSSMPFSFDKRTC